jgi:hypothetical protein
MASLKEYYNTTAGAIALGCGGATSLGQTFTAASSYTIKSVKIAAGKFAGSGVVTFAIRATSSGLPTGADLVSGTYDFSTLASVPTVTWVEISFGAGLALTSGVKYAICSHAWACGNATNGWYEQRSDVFANGNSVISSNWESTWAARGGGGYDLCFECWGDVAGWGNISKVNGVVAASMAKYNGVAVASIAKVNGVAV